MKLTSLLLTALTATALVSCSNDENMPAPEPKLIDTYLSITANADGIQTKAAPTLGTEEGTDKENFIHKLTALVFYDDGTFAASKDTVVQWDKKESASIDKITNIKVKVSAMTPGEASTTKLKLVLIANAEVSGITNIKELEGKSFGDISKLSTTEIEVNKNATFIPMSSKVISITDLKASEENWVNDDGGIATTTTGEKTPILLSRYVARVELESLKTSFTENNAGATFKLLEVSLVNVSGKSLFVAPAEKNLYPGVKDNPFSRGAPANVERKDYNIVNGSTAESLKKEYTNDGGLAIYESGVNFETNANGIEKSRFYAFEYNDNASFVKAADGAAESVKDATVDSKGDIHTMMLIKGTYTPKGATLGVEKYYRIPIKISDAGYGVKRNTIYKVNATLTGEGASNPDENLLNAMISFQITVEDWTVINQNESDVN